MAPAVGTVAVVIDAPVLVLVWLVVSEMAPGTIRQILGCLPVHCLRISLMALGAIEVASMVKRLVDQTEMQIGMRKPRIGHVADIAFLIRNEVPVVLAGCCIAVMAGRARTQDLCMVHVDRRRPDSRGVTVLTHVRTENVCRVFTSRVGAVMAADAIARDINMIEVSREPRDRRMAIVTIVTARDVRRVLAGRYVAIVTRATSSENLRVIDRISRCPDDVVMAVLADVGCRDMRRVFAGRVGTIMAADAVSGDVGVIEVGRNPRVSCVAVIAVVTARDVRRVLAGRYVAIVTRATSSENLRVIDRISRIERHAIVTVLADISRQYVSGILARGLHAIMTVGAVARDIHMIEVGGSPCDARMAIVTIVAARDVRGVLAGCCLTIVTGIARSQDLRVINREGR